MSTLGFILVYLKSIVLGPRKKDSFRPPESIEGYRLLSVRKNRACFVGFYQNDTGKKVVVKIWRGCYKDADYYFFIHEIRMHRLFAKVLERTDLPESIREVRVPKLIYTRAENQMVMMMQEYVDGISPRLVSDGSRRISTFHKVVEFMHFVGAQLTPEERRDIPVRTVGSFMITFPLIVAYALSKRPEMAKQICRAALGFLFSIPALLKNAQLVSLAHRDLHFRNIILNEDGIYVVDLERCTFTNPMYEYIITLATEWRDVEFREALIGQINAPKRFRDAKALFRGFALHRAVHVMTENVRPANLDKFAEFLRYAVALPGEELRSRRPRALDKKADKSTDGHP